MPVRVIVPTPLRRFADQRSSIECEAATVGDALWHLTTSYGELKKHLYTDDGRLRSFVNVYLNDEDIRVLKQEQTQIKDGDTITIVPSIAGGTEDAGLPFIV
ncbi:MAG: MoaD/ThiS family protein [Candidatus Acidiferrales bacterium]